MDDDGPTPEQYARDERTSDGIVGRWLLAITVPIALGALIAWPLGVDPLMVGIPLELITIAVFVSWASRRTRGLLPQRQAIRPVRLRWVIVRLAIAIPVIAAVAVLLLALGS